MWAKLLKSTSRRRSPLKKNPKTSFAPFFSLLPVFFPTRSRKIDTNVAKLHAIEACLFDPSYSELR